MKHFGEDTELPVACAVADREENGFVFSASLFEGLLTPGVPVNLKRMSMA